MTCSFAPMLTVHLHPLRTRGGVPLTTWLTSRHGGRMTRSGHALFGRVGDRIEENVGGIRLAKTFANEDHERRLLAADGACDRASTALRYPGMRITPLGELGNGGFGGVLLLARVFFRPSTRSTR